MKFDRPTRRTMLGTLGMTAAGAILIGAPGALAADAPPAAPVAPDNAATGGVRLARVPDGGIQPQAHVGGDGRIHMIYFKGDAGGGDIFYVTSGDDGRAFSKPMRVNTHPGSAIAAGSIRGAHLSMGRGDWPHVAWMGSKKAKLKAPGDAMPMLYTRLKPDGSAFEEERNLIQQAVGLDGGGTVAADARGNVWVAWHAGGKAGAHGAGHGGGETERAVYIAYSHDDGKSFTTETRAVEKELGACACCGMSGAAGGKAGVYFFYRAAADAGNRPMTLLMGQERTFGALKMENWAVNQCPMSSSVVVTDEKQVLLAWETAGQVKWQRMPAWWLAGRLNNESGVMIAPPGTPGNRKHPALAMGKDGRVLLAWAEGTGWNKGGTVAWQIFDKDGKPEEKMTGRAPGLPVWGLLGAVTTGKGEFVIFH